MKNGLETSIEELLLVVVSDLGRTWSDVVRHLAVLPPSCPCSRSSRSSCRRCTATPSSILCRRRKHLSTPSSKARRFQLVLASSVDVAGRKHGFYTSRREKCVPRSRSDTTRRRDHRCGLQSGTMTCDLLWGNAGHAAGAGSDPRETGDRGSTAGQATLTRGFGPLCDCNSDKHMLQGQSRWI